MKMKIKPTPGLENSNNLPIRTHSQGYFLSKNKMILGSSLESQEIKKNSKSTYVDKLK